MSSISQEFGSVTPSQGHAQDPDQGPTLAPGQGADWDPSQGSSQGSSLSPNQEADPDPNTEGQSDSEGSTIILSDREDEDPSDNEGPPEDRLTWLMRVNVWSFFENPYKKREE